MKRGALLILLLAVLGLFLLGGDLMVTAVDRDRVRRALRAASQRHGLDPDWLDAIGKVEGPNWRPDAVNLAGPDGARGGAWGPTQMTEQTARGIGYAGDMHAFTTDPDVAAEWSASYLARGAPRDFADAVAWWNAGRYHADADSSGQLEEGEAPSSTVDTYWPRAVNALAYVQANPVDGEPLA